MPGWRRPSLKHMKTPGVLLLLLAGGILFWIGRSAAPADYVPPRAPDAVPLALTGEVPAGCEVVTLAVEGMCCTNCSAKLYRALVESEGVRAAGVDPTLGRAEVLVAAGTRPEDLARAMTFDAYVATPLP
jgi:copper chaperone CopZ